MKIKYEQLYPAANYLNCRIGLEMDVDDNANIEFELANLKHITTAFHMKEFPFFYKDGVPLYLPQSATTLDYKGEDEMKGTKVRDVVEPIDKIESWKTVISMCTSITALERFKPQVDREQNQELTEAYNNKLKQLQDVR